MPVRERITILGDTSVGFNAFQPVGESAANLKGDVMLVLGASNAGFAKEIDHPLTRVAEIEKHLGIGKEIAA